MPSSFKNSRHQATAAAAQAKPNVTIFTTSYPPAFLAGGPARSVHALVEALASDFSFFIVTSAFDGPNAISPMPSVMADRWHVRGHAQVWYDSQARTSARTTVQLLRETKPQVIYLNSLFSYRFTVLPLLIARLMFRDSVVSLAPRGELSIGALSLKSLKKRIFIKLLRFLRVHKQLVWHASTDLEKSDIEREFSAKIKSYTATNLRGNLFDHRAIPRRIAREPDDFTGLSLIFFSRITPMKNLKTAIEGISLVAGNIRLSIAGPIEDAAYWDECTETIRKISNPDRIRYIGAIPADDVIAFLSNFDLLVLPTRGENFGHVVLESLAAGTPVIVGTNTPWQQVEKEGAGWLCEAASPQSVAALIERFLSLSQTGREQMRKAAYDLALSIANDPQHVHDNRQAFRELSLMALPGN
jgi:glycosyltransferase involved in cell wall biosynthesis